MTPSSRIKIHIAHGDPLVAAGLAVSLQRQPDFEAYVWPAGNLSSATASDLPRPDVVVADYDSGMRLITSAAAKGYRVVILTHSDGEARIRDALEQGARGYLLLGCSLKELFDGLRSVRAGGLAIGPTGSKPRRRVDDAPGPDAPGRRHPATVDARAQQQAHCHSAECLPRDGEDACQIDSRQAGGDEPDPGSRNCSAPWNCPGGA